MRSTICFLTITALLSLNSPHAWAEPSPKVEVLKGLVRVRPARGDWGAGIGRISDGSELETGPDGGAVLTLPDSSRLRLAPSTRLRLDSSQSTPTLHLASGCIFAELKGAAVVHGPSSEVQASSGSFVYDVSGPHESLRVVAGNARLVASEVGFSLLPKLPALGSLQVPAGLEAVAGGVLGPIAAAEAPGDPSDFGPVESMGQDEVRQDARELVGATPGLNPLVILGALLAGGGLIGLLAGGGSSNSGTGGGDGGATGVPASP